MRTNLRHIAVIAAVISLVAYALYDGTTVVETEAPTSEVQQETEVEEGEEKSSAWTMPDYAPIDQFDTSLREPNGEIRIPNGVSGGGEIKLDENGNIDFEAHGIYVSPREEETNLNGDVVPQELDLNQLKMIESNVEEPEPEIPYELPPEISSSSEYRPPSRTLEIARRYSSNPDNRSETYRIVQQYTTREWDPEERVTTMDLFPRHKWQPPGPEGVCLPSKPK